MIVSHHDPFATNPYVAPVMQESVGVSHASPAGKSCWRWLAAAVVVEAAMTLTMVTLHSSSPRVTGLNVYALANLFLSGALSITFAWLLGQRSAERRTILIAQLANLLIWLTFGTIIHVRFGIHRSGEGSLLLTSGVASAMLALIASLVSSGTFRSRSA